MRIWIEKWMAFHAILSLFSTIYFLLTFQIEIIGIAVILSFFVLYVKKYFNRKGIDFLFEPANMVTSIRLLLLLSLLFISFSSLQIAFIAFLVLLADGIDGYLARKFKTSSGFGAYLDMETDAFYVLALSCLLYQDGTFGLWIISLGLLRYLYFIALLFFKPPEQKEERSFLGRLIAVLLMGALITGFVLPLSISKPVIVLAAILVFYSFGTSFWNVLKINFKEN